MPKRIRVAERRSAEAVRCPLLHLWPIADGKMFPGDPHFNPQVELARVVLSWVGHVPPGRKVEVFPELLRQKVRVAKAYSEKVTLF